MKDEKSKKAKILNAVEKAFKDKRYHELTLDEVAKAAKIGKGTIYLYFKDKEDLLFQLAMHGHDELCQAIAGSVSSSDAPFEKLLEKVCATISEFMLGRLALLKAIDEQMNLLHKLSVKYQAEFSKSRGVLIGAIAAVLKKGRAQGLIRRDMDLETQAAFLVELMRGRDHAFKKRPPIKTVVDIFLNGAKGR